MAVAEIPQQQSVPGATPAPAPAPKKGHRLERHFTREGVHPYEEIAQLPAPYRVRGVVALTVPGLDAERHLVLIERN